MKQPRFEVDTLGMRALHAGRPAWQLAKELVANAWDETISKCTVELKPIGVRKALLVVEDNGNGFWDIRDAWTLMKHTPKRAKPDVRGRFNMGEKEILAVCISAKVITNGYTVVFPKGGGRRVTKSGKRIGTRVECVMPWGQRQVADTVNKLKQMLPPVTVTYIVNGEAVPHRQPAYIVEAVLETVMQFAPGHPLRTVKRRTCVELYSAEDGTGKLFELGIPVQDIACPYWVNVLQKVPLPPNREMVKDGYLQDIYRIVLEATADRLTEDQAAASWVRIAIEDNEVQINVVRSVILKRFGEKVALWSSDVHANERAIENGYLVVHGRTLSREEREAMIKAGLKYTSELFSVPAGNYSVIPESEWTEGMRQVARYTIRLAQHLLGKPVHVEMYRQAKGEAVATYHDNTVSFNVARLGAGWFDDPVRPETTKVILHELAHSAGNGHDWVYDQEFQRLAARAVHLALERPEIFGTYESSV